MHGKRWNLRFVPTLGPKKLADCDPPDARGKEIRIASGLRGERRLEVIIHELLHAGCWPLSEECVTQLGSDLARELWKMGYKES